MFAYTTRTAAMISATMAAVVAIGTAAPARAQDDAQDGTTDQLLACDAMTDPTEKLACFDAVVESLKSGPAAPAVSSLPAPAQVSPPSAARTTTLEPPAVSPVAEAPPVEVAPVPAAAVSSSIPTGSPDAPADKSTAEIDDFGRDSMKIPTERKDKKIDAKPVRATIVRTWKNHDERFSVELDNGQVWRETEGSRVGQPKEGRSVELFEGRFGGYRMRIENIPKTAWVRRTK